MFQKQFLSTHFRQAASTHHRLSAVIFCASLMLCGAASAQNAQQEEQGQEAAPTGQLPVRDAQARAEAFGALPMTGLLLVPESTNDRVMAFDPATGNLIDADFIPADPTNLATPIHAILAADGNSILVSDQINDAVQQYALDGTYIGLFAPAGGVDTAVLDNIRGISLDPANGNLLVSVGGGGNADSIAEFDTAGNFLGNRVANAAGGLDSPFDVLVRSSDILTGGITSDMIHSYDLAGGSPGVFAAIDTFPEQLANSASGGLLVANFSGTQEGVVEYDAAGMVIGTYDPATLGGYRGVFELPNGNILTTNGAGVHEIDRLGNLVETKIAGVSARFIEFIGPTAPPLPPPSQVPTLSHWALFFLVGLMLLMGLSQRHHWLPKKAKS